MVDYARQFGARLSRMLWALNKSAFWLSWKVGVHYNTVRLWLKGRYTPRMEQLPALRAALGCTYEELIEGNGDS